MEINIDKIQTPHPLPTEFPLKPLSKEDVLDQALLATERAKAYLFSIQKQEGHWCAELQSNSTITAEYIFLCQILGIDLSAKREKLIQYFFSDQKEEGSWGIAYNSPGDVSTTAEVYLSLRLLGVDATHVRMKCAEDYIRSQGGIEKVRVFTRINFALFGLFPWDAIPVIPPEFILLPSQSPVNIYSFSSWARGTIVPLLILFHHKPVFALPNGKSENNPWLDHLWIAPFHKKIPYALHWTEVLRKEGISWRSLFSLTDQLLHYYEQLKPSKSLRQFALKKCEQWVLEHQEKSGDWAGIFPPMFNGILALYAGGYDQKSDPVKRGLEAMERFALEDEQGLRMQACVSPVWDTILSMVGIIDAGIPQAKKESLHAVRKWIEERQILANYGDWKVYNPTGPAGGWSFEYVNTWYPDVDDTAAVVIGFLKHDPESYQSHVIQKAIEWTVSMQNKDGGWAAFDINNDKAFLNQIPFSDMDSLCDPSSPDVTGRVLEALGILRKCYGWKSKKFKYHDVCERGLAYLRKSQESEGSWYGRWGVNYIYGTSNVLCGLSRLKVPASDSMVTKALAWLKQVQNVDGGWGECLESYKNKSLMGKGSSTASQTAWGLMGLLAYLPPADPVIQKGIRWLVTQQKINGDAGTWDEKEFTGTGFPNHFYIRYHLYRHYFPLMALGRFCSLQQS